MKARRNDRAPAPRRLRELPKEPFPPIPIADKPAETKRENLYRAIRNTRAFMDKRHSPEPFMEELRQYYPAPQYFLESNRKANEKLGLSRIEAFYYSIIPSLTRTCLSQRQGMAPKLSTPESMAEYLKTLYIGVHVECFYLIMLNGHGRLIHRALLQKGGADHAPFYLGQVISEALREEAKYVVLAHNHPGGTRRPSKEDLHCTLRALNAFATMQIPMLDHMIVARDTVVSIRGSGLLPSMLWKASLEGQRIPAGWSNEPNACYNNSSEIHKSDDK